MAVAVAQPKPRTRRKLTFEEFLQRPEGEFSEWVDGRLLRMSVDIAHQDVCGFLMVLLLAFADTRDLGTVLSAPALMRLASRPSGREPDVMFIAKANAGRIVRQYVDGPADLVVEVVSADSRVRDRREKYYEYAKAGVREYWLIDPELSSVEFFRLGDDGAYYPIVAGDDGRLHSLVLHGLAVDPDWLLRKPLPPIVTILREIGAI